MGDVAQDLVAVVLAELGGGVDARLLHAGHVFRAAGDELHRALRRHKHALDRRLHGTHGVAALCRDDGAAALLLADVDLAVEVPLRLDAAVGDLVGDEHYGLVDGGADDAFDLVFVQRLERAVVIFRLVFSLEAFEDHFHLVIGRQFDVGAVFFALCHVRVPYSPRRPISLLYMPPTADGIALICPRPSSVLAAAAPAPAAPVVSGFAPGGTLPLAAIAARVPP